MWVVVAMIVTLVAVGATGWRALVDVERIENRCGLEPAPPVPGRVRLRPLEAGATPAAVGG